MTDINTGTDTNNAIPIAILGRGFALGIGVAFVFALVISVVPEELFEPQSAGLALAFAIGSAAAVPTVWLIVAVTGLRARGKLAAVVAGMSGALAFDGLAIGFIPDLYGQDEMGSVGAMLLWAFCSLGVAGLALAKADRWGR